MASLSNSYDKVMVLGMDGLDPRIMEEMMAGGQLPNFFRLADGGTFARLQTGNPAISPVCWTNIATGTTPEQHGIYDFLCRNPKNYLPDLSLRKETSSISGTKYLQPRKRDGFWAYISKAGIPTTVIRWPLSFPAEKVEGRFLSGLGVPDLLGNEGRYLYYTTAGIAADDPSPHNVVEVEWSGNNVSTFIRGVAVGRDRFAELPMSVVKENAEAVTIDISGVSSFRALKGQWSDWVRLKFRVGFRNIYGIAKFMLMEAEPDLRLYVSPVNLDPTHQAFPITHPEKFGKELTQHLGLFHTLGIPEMVHPLSHGRYGYEEFLSEVRKIEEERIGMLEFELNRFNEGLLAFVFDHTDRVQHAFWAMRDKEHPAYDKKDAKKYSDVIPSLYRRMDKALGLALEKLDDKTLLLVVSDHGFGSFRRTVHLNRWLIDNGYMTLKGNNAGEGRGLFQDVDWPRTKAYALGFASVYLNVAGREGNGIVQSSREYSGLCRELADRLGSFKDPRNGTDVVCNAYIANRKGHDPNHSEGPDLTLGFNSNYRMSWQTALGGAPTTLIEDNTQKWSGDHIIDPGLIPGIIFCNKKLNTSTPRSVDLAPTVLECFGIERPEFMEGRALLES